MKIKIFLAALCFFSLAVKGQGKVGSIDTEVIIGLMPETKKVIQLLDQYTKRLDSSYNIQIENYRSEVIKFQKIEKDISEDFKKIKMKDLAKLEREVQKSQSNGQQLVGLKRDELMRPLYEKLRGVIAEIAKAEGYTHVLTTSGNEFAYVDPKFDLTRKVLDKLGIKIPEEKK